MKQRLLVAAIGVPLLILVLVFLPPLATGILVAAIAGAAAYGLQLRDRVVLLRRSWNPQTAALGLSALGMLLMSMTNPGAFCPAPYELLMVTLFALLEQK